MILKDTEIEGYEISECGRVFRKERIIKATKYGTTRVLPRREKKPSDNGAGYLFVQLYRENKATPCYVHRLVAIAFIPNPENKKGVNHKDGDKYNNAKSNVEWSTQLENNLHAIATGLNKGRGKPIEQLNLAGEVIGNYKSASEASIFTGIGRTAIQECCKPFRPNQGHTAGGFKWRFCS